MLRIRFMSARFLSTPSVWRATCSSVMVSATTFSFLSTPSVWRATGHADGVSKRHLISIHALRVEGDGCGAGRRLSALDFYPRPPCGGRPAPHSSLMSVILFLSTPSVWRATYADGSVEIVEVFLSTPSVWRATFAAAAAGAGQNISIHALRVEGDPSARCPRGRSANFYPRPPCGGRQQKFTKYCFILQHKHENLSF